MSLIAEIETLQHEMTRWRHDLHRYPEPSLHEQRTASKIAELLRGFGFDEVRERVGQSGVVGILRNGDGPMLGLAAALDGEKIKELGDPADYRSQQEGYMHALGHDGEVAMLLGAAQYLAKTRQFKGGVMFIFYSSYCGGIGARAIIEEGLFEEYPVVELYSLHNVTDLPAGKVAIGVGPFRGGVAELLVKIIGKEGMAAFPNRANNPILAASDIVNSLETLASSSLDPASPLLICVASFNAGNTFDFIPKEAELKGTVRFLNPEIENWLPTRIDTLVSKIAESYGVRSIVSYRMVTPPTINNVDQVRFARQVMLDLLGENDVQEYQEMTLLGGDIGFFLNERPGACISIGNGVSEGLLSPYYDFNDKVLPVGASVLARLVEERFKSS